MELFLIPPLDANVVNNSVSYTDFSSFFMYIHFFQRQSYQTLSGDSCLQTPKKKTIHKQLTSDVQDRHYTIGCTVAAFITWQWKAKQVKTSQSKSMVVNTTKTISTSLLPVTVAQPQRKQCNWNCTPNSLDLKATEANVLL